ncbi:expressed unknown protein [Seminavis robusta]|uniref:Uncharacterized protein n=1 Tax=Seminavis robusta TaxID=568900 RepID=A0A9N8HLT3_9STRA|nr:expressed unknown protein [Seminavis robusta]|eukprot:Sro1057_g236290.1 n/a (392) ;mRNA; r:30486-31661
MQYASMQTLFDSLCQCLGTSPSLPSDGSDPTASRSPQATTPGRSSHSPVNDKNLKASPATRRTSRLELKDKQWDALFDSVTPNMNQRLAQHTHVHGGTPPASPDASPSGNRGNNNIADSGSKTPTASNSAIETAQALAKAKQAANPSRYHLNSTRDSPPPAPTRSSTKSHKRKRPICSRDDIFRSRKIGPTTRQTGCQPEGNCLNPISKFLSNHQGFANALCFATPVRDDDEEEEELKDDDRQDNNSLASDANTLNTCEDSMLLLDHKLAQMSQNQPPMPLFHDFKVPQNEPEGLRRIVDAETHSSAHLMTLWRQRQETSQQDPVVVARSSSSSSRSSNGGTSRGRARVRVAPPTVHEDEQPPSMKAASTSSSSASDRSQQAKHQPQIGEI